MRKIHTLFVLGRILSDGFMTLVAFLSAYYLRAHHFELFSLQPPQLMPIAPYLEFTLYAVIMVWIIFGIQGRYLFIADRAFSTELKNTLWSYTSAYLIIIVGFFFLRYFFFSRFIFGMGWGLGLLLIPLGRIILRSLRRIAYNLGYGRERVLIIGTDDMTDNVADILKKDGQYKLIGVIHSLDFNGKTFAGLSVLGGFSELESVVNEYGISLIILAEERIPDGKAREIMHIAHRTQTGFMFVPDAASFDLSTVEAMTMRRVPFLRLRSNRITGWQGLVKTVIDKAGAFFGLILLSPIMLWVYYKIWKDLRQKGHPDSPIFRNERIGKDGEVFECLKFRSMVPGAHKQFVELSKKQFEETGGEVYQILEDPRVTPFGHFIRKTSLDELPQLWNVLKGDMSLIGPRPHCVEEIEAFYNPDERRVFTVKPGITGYSQIHGRSFVPLRDELRYEVYYMQNWSLMLDAEILWKTLLMVVKRENVV